MIDLKAQYGSTYRIIWDESAGILDQTREERLWLQQIKARYGHIYVHSHDTLGGFTNRRGIISRLIALPGVTLHQRGDSECTVIFHPTYLPHVAELLKAYRRRRLSPEKQAAGAERLRQWHERRAISPSPEAANGPQDASTGV